MWTMTTVTRRTPTCARSEHACTLFRLSRHSHWHITFHMAQGRSHVFHPSPYHPWWAFLSELLHFSFYLALLFSFLFLSFFLMYDSDYNSVTNNLRDSVNGTFVNLDDDLPLTKLKTVSELYNLEIHQKKAEPDYHRLMTMVKVSNRIYEWRILKPEMEIIRQTPWSRITGKTAWTKDSSRLLSMES